LSLDTLLEGYVCIILTIEFLYDYNLNQHVKSLKRRTKRKFDFEQLTQGEHR